MIPLVGFIVATYCIARLLQVPAEAIEKKGSGAMIWLLLVSVAGIIGITILAFNLLVQSLTTTTPTLG